MRRLAYVLIVLAGWFTPIQGADDSLSIRAEFLFQSGDTAYFRCDRAIGVYDSVAAFGYGEVIDAVPPLWMLRTLPGFVAPPLRTTVMFRYIVRPRGAATVDLLSPADPWDPLKAAGSAGYVAGAMIHSTLFRDDGSSLSKSPLVSSYEWRGRDLVVVVDTSQHFGDGAPVTAAAVKASIERYLWYRRSAVSYGWDRAIAGVEAYREGRMDHVVGLIPRSVDTLQFNLLRACYTLPERLTGLATAIVRWTVAGNESPVTATAGYYGARSGDTLVGRATHGGTLVLTVDSNAAAVQIGDVDSAGAASTRIPLLELVVVRPGPGAAPELVNFLRYAIDRRAMASVACGACAQFPPDLLPAPIAIAQDSDAVNMDEAVTARGQISGKPVVRVAASRGNEAGAEYLITALKAWEFKAVPAGAGGYDLRVERWRFDSFEPDALAEGVLGNLGYAESDSLVARLWNARSIESESGRQGAYASLFARLNDLVPYVVVYQPVVELRFDRSLYESERDAYGRPVGPVYRKAGGR